MKITLPTIILILTSIMLTACGGGGGTPNPPQDPPGDTSPPPTSTPDTISFGWDIPSTRSDGAALSLSEINGYRIYLTTDNSTSPTQPYLDIADSTVTDYTIVDLTAGTYYVYVTTYDVNGDESPLSESISTTIL